jgi:hypothetical protein
MQFMALTAGLVLSLVAISTTHSSKENLKKLATATLKKEQG